MWIVFFIKRSVYDCNVWVPGAVILSKVKKILKAIYEFIGTPRKSGKMLKRLYFNYHYQLKWRHFMKLLYCFSWKYGNQLIFSIKFWKRFGALQFNLTLRGSNCFTPESLYCFGWPRVRLETLKRVRTMERHSCLKMKCSWFEVAKSLNIVVASFYAVVTFLF